MIGYRFRKSVTWNSNGDLANPVSLSSDSPLDPAASPSSYYCSASHVDANRWPKSYCKRSLGILRDAASAALETHRIAIAYVMIYLVVYLNALANKFSPYVIFSRTAVPGGLQDAKGRRAHGFARKNPMS